MAQKLKSSVYIYIFYKATVLALVVIRTERGSKYHRWQTINEQMRLKKTNKYCVEKSRYINNLVYIEGIMTHTELLNKP